MLKERYISYILYEWKNMNNLLTFNFSFIAIEYIINKTNIWNWLNIGSRLLKKLKQTSM